MGVEPPDCQVEPREPPRGVVRLLAVKGHSTGAATTGFDEHVALHEHSAGAATRVEDPPIARRKHLDQETHDAARRVELPAVFSLRGGETHEEVFVHSAEHIAGAARRVGKPNRAHEIDEFAETAGLQGRTGVVLGQHSFEDMVVALDRRHCIVDQMANLRPRGVPMEKRPARILRHENDTPRRLTSCGGTGGRWRCGVCLERVRDVLEGDEPEHQVLVLGHVHGAAELVHHPPERRLEAQPRIGLHAPITLQHAYVRPGS